jgi:hypothetical protein
LLQNNGIQALLHKNCSQKMVAINIRSTAAGETAMDVLLWCLSYHKGGQILLEKEINTIKQITKLLFPMTITY